MAMDPRILCRPERRQSDTRRNYLDRLKKHQAELQKLIGNWSADGWNSPEQEREYRDYEGDLATDIVELENEVLRAERRVAG